MLIENIVMYALWGMWCAYWCAASVRAKPSRRRESWASGAAHGVPLTVAVLLLALPRLPGGALEGRFVPFEPGLFWASVVVVVLGMALTVWARRVLAGNWSALVTIKDDHELIRRGPYRFVRHPIYSGLLVALAASAVARGEWRGLVGVAIAFAALWHKLGTEERWLTETFGPAYQRYQAEVSALIPFLL